MMKKKLLLLFTLILSGCTNTVVNDISPEKAVLNNSGDIQPVRENDLKLSFSLKAAGDFKRIKSVDGYLTKNYDDPFLTGANVYSDGKKFQVNVAENAEELTVTFPQVPDGGPYYAVIGAYDADTLAALRNNITVADNSILSAQKSWARSANSVTITGGVPTFSDGATAFKVSIKLIPFNKIEVDIEPEDGPATKGDIQLQ